MGEPDPRDTAASAIYYMRRIAEAVEKWVRREEDDYHGRIRPEWQTRKNPEVYDAVEAEVENLLLRKSFIGYVDIVQNAVLTARGTTENKRRDAPNIYQPNQWRNWVRNLTCPRPGRRAGLLFLPIGPMNKEGQYDYVTVSVNKHCAELDFKYGEERFTIMRNSERDCAVCARAPKEPRSGRRIVE